MRTASLPLFSVSFLLLAAGPPPVTGGQESVSALESGAVRSVELPRPPGTRVRCFRLDPPPVAGERAPGPSGLVRWIDGPDPEEGWRLETEVTLFDADTRVIHTERLRLDERKLTFRELRERSGRTVLLTWTPDENAQSIETIGGEVRRRDFTLPREAFLPLTLVEEVRRGRAIEGSSPVYQPLSGTTDELLVSVSSEGAERVLELTRTDGTLAGTYRFRGAELESFRWQEGGARATRIAEEEYARILAARGAPAVD